MYTSTIASKTERDIYSVSRLNRETKYLLSGHFACIWVEGEISNLSTPSSGHLYFTLKDASAQVRCAMFRTVNRRLAFKPENGDQVVVRATVSLYEPRGDFQLVVEQMEEAGDGALTRAFEQLKKKLAAEGLFETRHKKPIPTLPRQVGVITSPSGAAIRDILTVLSRRFPAIPVIIYPTSVQGADAPREIAGAIATADERQECDVLLLARGGGSLEDLWAFNNETVARAIFDCTTPVVSGVGHETDVTIADFVADLRAPTPSAAAEAVSPDRNEWLSLFGRLEVQLGQRMGRKLEQEIKALSWVEKRLQQVHPGKRLLQWAQRLDELEPRLIRALQGHCKHLALQLENRASRLYRHHPAQRLAPLRTEQQHLFRRLQHAMTRRLENCGQALSETSRALETVSPLATLSRGYAIVFRCDDNSIVRTYHDAKPGERVEAKLGEGRLICQVEKSIKA